MNNRVAVASVSRVDQLHELLSTEFHDTQLAYKLLDELLQHNAFSKQFCLQLLGQIRNRQGVSWEVRRLAILMLEHQALLIPPSHFADYDFLLTALQLKESGANQPLSPSVLKEGYSSTDFRTFVPEFRHRLARLERVHKKVRGRRTSNAALREFIELSSCECKLTLARYVFTPKEIVDRILTQLQVTEALPDVDYELANAIKRDDSLPPFEAEILKQLVASSYIYWVIENTSSKINSLVEYPATSVVLVVKPPGSNYEFEFKRAGRKGHNPLGVVYARNGLTVPPSHRLDGGCMQYLLRFEADAAFRISSIYSLVHKSRAPVPKYIFRSTIDEIPIQNTTMSLLRYFTDAGIFGDGFSDMRRAMAESVRAFQRENYPKLPDLPGDFGLTGRFIGIAGPSQAILSGTTSFRLNKLSTYLSSEGPKCYFGEGLQRSYTVEEAKSFADALLEEVLGVYIPPDVEYHDQQQYVDAALSLPANRARADRIYLSMWEETARFWGTLLSVRGYSRGESFVGRNVGLRSIWENGDWKTKIIFMDHDALVIPGRYSEDFAAHRGLASMRIDERYIWEPEDPELFPTCIAGYLRSIYRIQTQKENEARALVDRVLKDAYKKTQQALLSNQHLRSYFNPTFLRRLLLLDTLTAGLLDPKPESSSWQAWKDRMSESLREHGYTPGAFERYREIIETYRRFLQRYSFLFDSNSTT